MKTVLVVDDHPVVRDGVVLLLRADPLLTVAGFAASGRAAITRAAELRPDVVLLDLRLPDLPAAEVVVELRHVHPAGRIVVFTAHADHVALAAALAAGADGALLKDVDGTDLSATVRRVLCGERVVDPRIMPRPAAPAHSGLTRRECEVLRFVAQGKTNPEIAESTGLTRNTVKTYLQSALHKLGARNRVEAIGKAGEVGLL
ncbi:MAG TPA: response regulator transcription factor [Kutzneria sp.]|jgi:DNA-binding NarL/FixJ family response regulator